MVEAVAKDIYRIGVKLPHNPLKELNSYFIRGPRSDLLIDTGFRCQECQRALEEGLKELGSEPARRDVLLTHIHSDHSGMADLFAGPDRHVYISRADLDFQKSILYGDSNQKRNERFVREGFAPDMVEYIFLTNPARKMALPTVDERFVGLEDKDILSVGEYNLQLLMVPGHTPGNAMFWAKEQGILFSGDHVLFDITPNITQWESMEDSLGAYMASLKKFRDLPVRVTLPGHRKSGDYKKRIEELLAHHQRRLKDSLDIIERFPGLTAYEIAGKMSWRIRARSWEEFPPMQKWFAVGECLSHLDHLVLTGAIRRQEKDNRQYYTKVSGK